MFEIKQKDIFTIHSSTIHVPVKHVLNGMQMQPENADDDFKQLIEQQITTCQNLAKIQIAYRIIEEPKIDLQAKKIELGKKLFSTGKNITNLLAKSEKILVYAITIGNEVEKLAQEQMNSGNMLDSLIFDIIGSELAENTGIWFHSEIEQKLAKQNLKVSNRFSPGYCDWPVENQQELFTLLGEYTCGISLTKSSLMLPVKSISGFIGIGSQIKRLDHSCRICNDMTCLKRKV